MLSGKIERKKVDIMANFGRSVERTQARKLFKQFLKSNPQYRAMTFKDFFKLKRAGFISKPTDHVHKAHEQAKEVTTQDFEDVMLDDIEEANEITE